MQDCWSFTVGPWLIVKMQPALKSSVGITSIDVHLNWRNWFHFLILEGGLEVSLIDHMIFLSSFVDVTRMSMSTFLYLAQLDSGSLCLFIYAENDLWSKWIQVYNQQTSFNSRFLTDSLYALLFLCFFLLQLHASYWLLSLAWSKSQLKINIFAGPNTDQK